MFCFLHMTTEMQAYPCIFTVLRLCLTSIKNLPIYPCKKYLLGTNGLKKKYSHYNPT